MTEAVVRPATANAGEFQVAVGVRLQDGAASGRIEGVRIRYEDFSGARYELILPWSLNVTAAAR